MAKKKTAAKSAKKATKAKKTTAKKKTPVKAKAKAKAKPVAKKTKAAKPAKVKKTATKAAPKAKAAKTAVKKTSKTTAKKKVATPKKAQKEVKKITIRKAAPSDKKTVEIKEVVQNNNQAATAAKIAQSAQLNFFQMPNQRPIAHKPAKPSSHPEDKTRYTEEELKEFEELINGKLEKAREEYRILKDTLNRTNDEGTDSTSGGNTKVLEDGAETAEKENLSQLAARQQKYITNLENALVRIKNGTYGICSVTGKLISKERLIAVPHTTQSIEAKLMQQD